MHHHIHKILPRWAQQKDNLSWALASIVEISGSSYRKPGAMMLINEQGQSIGILSGGCLEADVILQAQKAMHLNKNKLIEYDTYDDGEHNLMQFLGCGGAIRVYIQPLTKSNNYQNLELLLAGLDANKSMSYAISYQQPDMLNQCAEHHEHINANCKPSKSQVCFNYRPRPYLAIFGAGLDAIPVVNMAQTLGWRVSLYDYRSTHVSSKLFSNEAQIIKTPFEQVKLPAIQAAVVMGHNLNFDAKSLSLLQSSNAIYVGLLGPKHRQEKVINLMSAPLIKKLYGPVGLNIGGELPEEIALSVVAQIQAVLNNKYHNNKYDNKLFEHNQGETKLNLKQQALNV